jgi:pimeloyl-ACP methyl ester carboxylesterase
MHRIFQMSLVLCLLAVEASASLDWLERRAIYPFSPLHITPEAAGLPTATEHRFAVAGAEIFVWSVPPASGQPVVFYLHGNSGNLASRAARFRFLTQQGFGLLAPTYRGASGSDGYPSEPAIIADTLAVWQAASDLVGETPAIIYGESLGTGVALALDEQLRRRSEAHLPKGIVLEAPYLSMPDIAKTHFPLPEPILSQIRSRWNSARRAPDVITPVLVLHGTDDQMVPYAHGQAIFDLLASSQKELITVEAGTHNGLWTDPTARDRLIKFIRNIASP